MYMQEKILIDTLLGLSACRYGVEQKNAAFQMQLNGAINDTWTGKASFYPASRVDNREPALRLQCYTHQQKGFVFHIPTTKIFTGQSFALTPDIREDALLLLLSGFDGLMVPVSGFLSFDEVNNRFYGGRFALVLRNEVHLGMEKMPEIKVNAAFRATPGWPNFDLLIGGVHCLN